MKTTFSKTPGKNRLDSSIIWQNGAQFDHKTWKRLLMSDARININSFPVTSENFSKKNCEIGNPNSANLENLYVRSIGNCSVFLLGGIIWTKNFQEKCIRKKKQMKILWFFKYKLRWFAFKAEVDHLYYLRDRKFRQRVTEIAVIGIDPTSNPNTFNEQPFDLCVTSQDFSQKKYKTDHPCSSVNLFSKYRFFKFIWDWRCLSLSFQNPGFI